MLRPRYIFSLIFFSSS
ncbi:hypothetical protein RSAG8_00384, partial [Rhizoctonia solani AG-8 WAC10335]